MVTLQGDQLPSPLEMSGRAVANHKEEQVAWRLTL